MATRQAEGSLCGFRGIMQPSDQSDGGNNVTKRSFVEGEQRVDGTDAGNYYYTRDHLGSVREVTDSSGLLKGQYDYDAWGNPVVVKGKMQVDFGYTGHYFHQPSGLNLAMYRVYSSTLGRWMSRDPLKNAELLQGPNLYGYVINNPTTYVDPLGLVAGVDDALIGIGIAEGITWGVNAAIAAGLLDWLWHHNENQGEEQAVDGAGNACPAKDLTPTGETREEDATKRGAGGGKNVEEGYVDSGGRPVTKQTVYDPTGKVVHGPHYRPGPFKIPK